MLLLLALLGCPVGSPVEDRPDDTGEPPVDDTDTDSEIEAPERVPLYPDETDTGCDRVYYLDGDSDGYGGGDGMVGCESPGDGWLTIGGDCDDSDVDVHPGAYEPCDSMSDRDCDGHLNGDGPCVLPSGSDYVFTTEWEYFWGPQSADLDVDGDGRDDLVFTTQGDFCYEANHFESAVQIVLASALGAERELDVNEAASITLTSPNDSGCLGAAFHGLGDLDGDGLDELVVSEPAPWDASSPYGVSDYPGSVYVFTGASLAGATSLDISDAHTTIVGPEVGFEFGDNVIPVGDLDGDGLLEIAVGSEWGEEALRIFTGATLAAGGDLEKNDGVAVKNSQKYQYSGGGDLDGDGLEDLVVTAYRDSHIIYVFLGSTPIRTFYAEATADASVVGVPDRRASAMVVPDRDGDGYDELALMPATTLSFFSWSTLQAEGAILVEEDAADLQLTYEGEASRVSHDLHDTDAPETTVVRFASRGDDTVFREIPYLDLPSSGVMEIQDAASIFSAPEWSMSLPDRLGDIDGDGRGDLTFDVSYSNEVQEVWLVLTGP